MKIVRLTAENYKRLVAVEITPEGNTVLITGKNGAGKSSVLDAITSALCGKKYQPKKPILDGEDHAEVVVETENWIIKRTFTKAGGGTVTITNKDGMRAQSPQALLDKIVGKVGFDPMLFIRLGETAAGEREQLAIVMRLAGLDFSDIDTKIADTKTTRSGVRTEKERLEHEAKAIEVAEGTPDEEVSVLKLAAELERVNKANSQMDEIERHKSELQDKIADLEIEAEQISKNADRLEKEIVEANKAYSDKMREVAAEKGRASAYILELGDMERVDTEPIKAEMVSAEGTNAAVWLKKQKAELLEKAEAEAEKWRMLGGKMKKLDTQKAKRLSEAKMPLEGMSVTEDGVTIDDIPLSQINDAEKLKVGMGIAMAENPELRVILMKGNDLDEDSLKLVSKMAADKDFMVWIERIEGEGGIVIEDGSVKQ